MKRFLFLAIYMATICCAIFESPLQAHGFAAGTLVKSPTGYIPIEQITPGEEVICFDLQDQCVARKVTHIHQFKSRELAHLIINGEPITCDIAHQFYVFGAREPRWVQVRHLMRDWKILSHCVDACLVQDISYEQNNCDVFDLTVEEFHNYCVGKSEIHAHNVFPLVIVGVTWIFGEALVWTAGTGLVIGGAALITKAVYDHNRRRTTFHFDSMPREKFGSTHHNAEDEKPKADEGDADNGRETGAQAPGKPRKEDGFIPPKNWGGEKVKNPNGPGYGWPDKKGHVWIPTGPQGHGCPHWDVEEPGGGYRNVVPGGRIRGQK